MIFEENQRIRMFLELRELRSNGAIRKYQFIKKEENIHKAAVKTAALLRVWGIK